MNRRADGLADAAWKPTDPTDCDLCWPQQKKNTAPPETTDLIILEPINNLCICSFDYKRLKLCIHVSIKYFHTKHCSSTPYPLFPPSSTLFCCFVKDWMDCCKCSLRKSAVANQLLNIRLHECCKQLKRPVAVIPQCRYPETRSLETAGMSSFSLSLSLSQTFSQLVSLSFCMSFSLSFCLFLACASRAPTALCLSCRSLSRMHSTPVQKRERAHPGIMHTDMTICHWHRGQCKQWERCMWQNEKAERGSETPPLFAPSCSLTYTLASTYKYIHKGLLPWQQVFSYLGMVPFPCRNSSLKSIPALPCS